MNGDLAMAYTLDAIQGFVSPAVTIIGIGMWFNVWFVIWPNQQKALNIGGRYADLPAPDKVAPQKRP